MNPFSKLLQYAGALTQRAGENLMPAPEGGLLSRDQITAARQKGLLSFGLDLLGNTDAPSTLAAVGHGLSAAQGGYQDAGSGMLAQQSAAKQQNLAAQREAIQKKYAGQGMAGAQGMYMDLMQIGDTEGAKALEGVVREQMQQAGKAAESKHVPLQAIQLGDRVMTFDPATGKYTEGPERRMSKDELETKAEERALRRASLQSSMDQHDQMYAQQGARAFDMQNRDLVKTEQAFQSWKAAYDSAKGGNPAAYKSAIVNFASIADPKAQIRIGMLNYLEKVDPSIRGRADLAFQKLAEGKYPMYVLDNMMKHAEEIHKNTVQLYDHRRSGRVKVRPSLDVFIPTTDEAFPSAAHFGNSGAPERDLTKYMRNYSAAPIHR